MVGPVATVTASAGAPAYSFSDAGAVQSVDPRLDPMECQRQETLRHLSRVSQIRLQRSSRDATLLNVGR